MSESKASVPPPFMLCGTLPDGDGKLQPRRYLCKRYQVHCILQSNLSLKAKCVRLTDADWNCTSSNRTQRQQGLESCTVCTTKWKRVQ
eukprot:6208511-Pleurochrysis_carterae.AAC.3